MTRREAYFDAMVRHLGAAYYQALQGGATPGEVGEAVRQVAEAEKAAAPLPPSARRAGPWQVSDVMTTSVVWVSESASYKQVAQLLHENKLTALPVLAADGQVAGVVSEADLLHKQEQHEQHGWPHAKTKAKAEARTAGDLMTAPAVTIGPDELVGTAARLMRSRRIKRLPVVDADGRLVGIVSRADLLSVFLRPDEEIAAEANAVFTDILLAEPDSARALVRDGVVTLSGRLASSDDVAAAVRMIRGIDGVVAVKNDLTAPPSGNWPGAGFHLPT